MDLHALIDGLAVRRVDTGGAVRVTDLTEDSRTVLPGSLFVARAGLTADGRAFIAAAARDGAAAVLTDAEGVPMALRSGAAVLEADDVPLSAAQLAERFFGGPSSKLRLAGVTGTNGKSTVAQLTHGLLNAAGMRCGLVGTVTVDDGREVARSSMTTMPAIELSRTLATMVEHGCEAAVLEVSSHALDQHRVAALRFDAGVFTMLGSDHLDYHRSQNAYADSKSRLFSMLDANAVAIVNADDPACGHMLGGNRSRRVLCSAEPGADASAAMLGSGLDGVTVAMTGPFGAARVTLPMPGEHNAMNALQAACIAHAFGLHGPEIEQAFREPTLPPGRLERVRLRDDDGEPAVFVDFAHTADALEHALRSILHAAGGRRVCVVFGCGGDRDRGKRPQMGRVAAELADRLVLTSDNPRHERPDAILDEILAGIPRDRRGSVAVHADRARAIEHAVLGAEPGEVIVIAGKGHETEQIAADGSGGLVARRFDDREHALDALRRRRQAVRA